MLSNGDASSTPTPATGKRSIVDLFDDVTVRALRALYCSPSEWSSLFSGPGTDLCNLNTLGVPLSSASEDKLATALQVLTRLEMSGKPTSLEGTAL